jgi:beta-mannosidase
VLALRDLRPGGGWGILDHSGQPKSPWFALRRAFAPVALLLSDEGVNGLHVHLCNENAVAIEGKVVVVLYAKGEFEVDRGTRDVVVPPHGRLEIEVSSLFDSWSDVTYAYRFGPSGFDIVTAQLQDPSGEVVSEDFHLPLGLNRPSEPDLGLHASVVPGRDGSWEVTVSTRRFAEWVVLEIPHFRPSDSWFHLAPGTSRSIALAPLEGGRTPIGRVRALNAQASAEIVRWTAS